MSLKDTLSSLQLTLAENLLKKVTDGSATPAELNVARQLLKDNDITSLPSANPHLAPLAERFPFQTPEEQLPA